MTVYDDLSFSRHGWYEALQIPRIRAQRVSGHERQYHDHFIWGAKQGVEKIWKTYYIRILVGRC